MGKTSQNRSPSQPSLNLKTLIFIIAVFFISLGQLQRVQIANTVAIYGHDLFIFLFVILTALTTPINKKMLITFFQRWKYLCLFGLWTLGGLLINQSFSGFNIIPWMYFVRLGVYLLFGLSLKKQVQNGGVDHSWVQLIFKIMIFIFLFIGFFQYLYIPDLRFLGTEGWDVHYYRLAGNMLDPNFTGMLLLNLLITFVLATKNKYKNKLYLGLIIVLSIALTYSRSSYLAFAVIVGLTFLLSKTKQFLPKRMIYFLFTALLLFLPFLPKPGGLGVNLARTETINSRVEVNEAIVNQLNLHQLLIGKGLFVPSINTSLSNQVIHAKFPDNLLIFILSSTGVMGLFFVMTFFYKELKLAYNSNNFLVIFLLMGTLSHSMFNLTILEPVNLLTLLLCTQFDAVTKQQPLRLLKKVKS